MSSLNIISYSETGEKKMSMENFYEYEINIVTTIILRRYDYYDCYDYMSIMAIFLLLL